MQTAPRPSALQPVEDIDAPATETGRRERLRSRMLLGAALLILVAGAVYGGRWLLVGRFLESTDNAYLQADNAVVAPKVAGYIETVAVGDNQSVSQGQVLARIDDRDYRIDVAQGEADVAQAQAELGNIAAQIDQQKARLAQAEAALAQSKASAEFAGQEANRFNGLVGSGAVSIKQAQQAQSELKRTSAMVAEAQATQDATRKQMAVLESAQAKDEAMLKRAQAGLEQAKLRLSYTVLTAPIAGAIGDRSVRVGQYVQPGSRLLTIVPVQDVYLVANYKETQLRHFCRGEHVNVSLDMYPDLKLTGTIDSLAPGTGAQFALLPAENATGNFTKIVQRVPVKILLDRDSLKGVEIRPGLSAEAHVDTRTAPEGPCTTLR
jgi:membrane fusion protein (multidrug efflux system)